MEAPTTWPMGSVKKATRMKRFSLLISLSISAFVFACSGQVSITVDGDGGLDAEDVDGNGAYADEGHDAGKPADGSLVCEPYCSPGEACMGGACIADCRLEMAIACEPPLVCGPMSGHCVARGEECTPYGEFVYCGMGEFVPICGPGSVCDLENQVCLPAEGCSRVVCHMPKICQGIHCEGESQGEVTGIEFDAVPDVAPGAEFEVVALVSGTTDCGLSVTFEILAGTVLYTSSGSATGEVWSIHPETGDSNQVLSMPGSSLHAIGTLPSGEVWVSQRREEGCNVARLVDDQLVPLFPGVPCGHGTMMLGTDAAFYTSLAERAINDYDILRIDALSGQVSVLGPLIGTNIEGRENLGLRIDAAYINEQGAYVISFGPFVFLEPELPAMAVPRATCSHEICDQMHGNYYCISSDLEGSPEGRVYISFRSNPFTPGGELDGIIWSARELDGGDGRLELDQEVIRRFDSEATLANTVGIAVGLDGTLYAAHAGDPSLVLRRRSGQDWEELARDIPLSLTSDLELGVRSFVREIATVQIDGFARTIFTAPQEPGIYQVRVLVTDPQSGRVFTDRTQLVVVE